jgi:hypothetical protein
MYLVFLGQKYGLQIALHSMFEVIGGWKFSRKIFLVGREFPSFERGRESCLSASIAFLV